MQRMCMLSQLLSEPRLREGTGGGRGRTGTNSWRSGKSMSNTKSRFMLCPRYRLGCWPKSAVAMTRGWSGPLPFAGAQAVLTWSAKSGGCDMRALALMS